MGGQASSPDASKSTADSEGLTSDLKDDIQKWKESMAAMEVMFQNLCERQPEVGRIYETSKGLIQNPVKDFLKELVDKARPPVIYLLGRNGHGKSSLLNALAKQTVAEVGHVTPMTASAKVYDVRFEGKECTWKVVDSRGIFESTRLEGVRNLPVTEQVKTDVENFKPDIILHVVSCSEARTFEKDLKLLNDVFKLCKQDVDFPPVLMVLTKADIIGHTQQWPPKDHPKKQKTLEDLLGYIGQNVLSAKECKPLVPNDAYCGLELIGCKPFLYVIPIATVDEEPIVRWNIDNLSLVIGNKIPSQAWLYFYQGQEHKKTINDLTTKATEKFAEKAAAMFFFNIMNE